MLTIQITDLFVDGDGDEDDSDDMWFLNFHYEACVSAAP